METATVLLIDVESPYSGALREWAARYKAVVRAGSFDELAVPAANAELCVIYVSGGDARTYSTVRALLKSVRSGRIVLLTDGLRARTVVDLVRMGVADVIDLPSAPNDVAVRAFAHLASGGPRPDFGEVVGEAEPMRELRENIRAAARTLSNVLLLGETGTGKGLVARVIHDASVRASRPFVHVDCAALSASLIESELFGHERGAFTGATQLRPGRFELADDGTVFLDEIGDLDANLQAKLLRVLQERRYERVGGTRTLLMRARVIAATSRDLRRAVREGHFRKDLYFRLNVLQLRIPPLRERLDDVPILVRSLIRTMAQRLGVPTPEVSEGFYRRICEHSWPGNVRELMNVLERCLVHLRVDTLEAEDLDLVFEEAPETRPSEQGSPPVPREARGGADDEAEIRDALVATGGNVSRAARRLGIPRTTLRRRIREHGLGFLIPRD